MVAAADRLPLQHHRSVDRLYAVAVVVVGLVYQVVILILWLQEVEQVAAEQVVWVAWAEALHRLDCLT